MRFPPPAGRVDPIEDDFDLGELGSGFAESFISPPGAARMAAVLADGQLVRPRWIASIADTSGRTLRLPPPERRDPRRRSAAGDRRRRGEPGKSATSGSEVAAEVLEAVYCSDGPCRPEAAAWLATGKGERSRL